MDLILIDTDFVAIDVVDVYKSIIWVDRYNQYGDFELYIKASPEIIDRFKADYYLNTDKSNHTMIIESIKTEIDTDDGDYLIVSGRSLESILSRRIVWSQTIVSGNLQAAIRTLLDDAIIQPEDNARQISNFIFEESEDDVITNLTIDAAQYTGDNLYEVISSICSSYKIGFKIILNDNNQFVFSLYSGVNRSYEQIKNPFVCFSDEFDNLSNSSYEENKIDYKNVTLVAGEGVGASRKTATVGNAVGLERRELFTDARDLSTTSSNGTITAATYITQLQQRGIEKLTEHSIKKCFEGEADTVNMYVAGKDFFIGDLVQIVDKYGHNEVARISELIFNQDDSGYISYPTFKIADAE